MVNVKNIQVELSLVAQSTALSTEVPINANFWASDICLILYSRWAASDRDCAGSE